jgi:hypothetical protein
LTYGRETWVLTKRCPQNIESAEVKFHMLLKEYARLNKMSNHDIKSELQTPWLLIRKRTIPIERPLLVGEFQCQLLRIERSRVVGAVAPYGR